MVVEKIQQKKKNKGIQFHHYKMLQNFWLSIAYSENLSRVFLAPGSQKELHMNTTPTLLHPRTFPLERGL